MRVTVVVGLDVGVDGRVHPEGLRYKSNGRCLVWASDLPAETPTFLVIFRPFSRSSFVEVSSWSDGELWAEKTYASWQPS